MRETFRRALKAHIQNTSSHRPRERLNFARILRALLSVAVLAAIGGLAIFAGMMH